MDKIIAWLLDEDHEVSKEQPPEGAPVEWLLGVNIKMPVRVKILVQKTKMKRDRIAATLGVLISPTHKRTLEEKGPAATAAIMTRILESLIHTCPDCIVVVQPNPASPENIVVTKIIYEEELSRAKLASTMRVLTNAYLLIITVMNSELGSTGPAKKRDGSHPPSIL